MSLGAPEVLILLLLGVFALLPLVIGVSSLIDIAPRSDGQFTAAGQSRTTWLIVATLSLFVPCVWLAAASSLVSIRPKLPPRIS